MFGIIVIIILAAFAAGGIWAFVVSKKVKDEDKARYRYILRMLHFPVL